jgi:hypothetical protein
MPQLTDQNTATSASPTHPRIGHVTFVPIVESPSLPREAGFTGSTAHLFCNTILNDTDGG